MEDEEGGMEMRNMAARSSGQQDDDDEEEEEVSHLCFCDLFRF